MGDKKDIFGSFYFGLNCRVLITPKACISSKRSFGYHQNEVLYIIKPQEDARWRVMRYKGGSPPLMIYTSLRAAMTCQACGLDKKFDKSKLVEFFGEGEWLALGFSKGKHTPFLFMLCKILRSPSKTIINRFLTTAFESTRNINKKAIPVWVLPFWRR